MPAKRILPAVLLMIAMFGIPASYAKNSGTAELIRVIRDGQIDKVDRLLRKNPDINAKGDNGWTPLMYAIFREDIALIEKLLSAGADVNQPDADGITPLIAAIIQMPQPFMIQYLPENRKIPRLIALKLIEKGADPNMPDSHGNTPLIYAIISNQESIVAALILNGADPNKPDALGRTPLYFVKYSERAAKWAPANGALANRYRMRREDSDDLKKMDKNYAGMVAEARAAAKVDLERIRERMTELLQQVGGAAPGPEQVHGEEDNLLDSSPQRLGGISPVDQVMQDFIRRDRNGGSYKMLVRVAPDGTVKEALVQSGLPHGTSERLQKAALKLRYRPALKNAQPVEAWDTVIGFAKVKQRRY